MTSAWFDGTERLEWWGYQVVKKVWEICSRFATAARRLSDKQTDRHLATCQLPQHSPRFAQHRMVRAYIYSQDPIREKSILISAVLYVTWHYNNTSNECECHMWQAFSILVLCQWLLSRLLYGTEACLLNKSDLSSLDFVINRLFMKLFKRTILKLLSSVLSMSVWFWKTKRTMEETCQYI